ncbi:MAG: hypothetical protein V1909_00605, partial [Candidatus Micrarchaeota archaeon]
MVDFSSRIKEIADLGEKEIIPPQPRALVSLMQHVAEIKRTFGNNETDELLLANALNGKYGEDLVRSTEILLSEALNGTLPSKGAIVFYALAKSIETDTTQTGRAQSIIRRALNTDEKDSKSRENTSQFLENAIRGHYYNRYGANS